MGKKLSSLALLLYCLHEFESFRSKIRGGKEKKTEGFSILNLYKTIYVAL